MLGDAGVEDIAPRIRERPEDRGHVSADRLAFGPRSALAPAAIELGEHRRILHLGRVDVGNAGLRHGRFLRAQSHRIEAARALVGGMLAQRRMWINGIWRALCARPPDLMRGYSAASL